jgi:hypothetical protein
MNLLIFGATIPLPIVSLDLSIQPSCLQAIQEVTLSQA